MVDDLSWQYWFKKKEIKVKNQLINECHQVVDTGGGQ